MQHPSTFDDSLLALEVETALKALGIAASGDAASQGDLRSAVADLRAPASFGLRRPDGWTPALLAEDDELFGLL